MKLKPIPSARRLPTRAVAAAAARAEAAAPVAAATSGADGPAAADVRGLIDNATADRLYGWAWDAANPGARLRVELRLGGEPVADTVADFARPDLAKNGIGDGRHAFEFPLDPGWAERLPELTAVALGADGAEAPIATRLRRPDDAQVATQLQRAVEELAAAQGAARAEVAALRARADRLPDPAAVEGIAAAQGDLARKVEQLELWLTRLDHRLGEAGRGGDEDGPASGARARRLDPWQAALVAVLTGVASAALAAAVARAVLVGGAGLGFG